MPDASCKHEVINYGKHKKRQGKKSGKTDSIMWKILGCCSQICENILQYNSISCIAIFGPHIKPHGVCVLSKHYCMFLDTKLIHSTCGICWIPCEFMRCISMLDKNWTPGVSPHQQPCYKPVKDCTYSPILGSY